MQSGTVAIMPPGALGIGFFYHLTEQLQRHDGNVFFIGLDNSRSINALLSSGLQISDGAGVRCLPGEEVICPTLQAAWSAGRQPEILIVCPNPDQLLQVVSSLVALIEHIWDETEPNAERKIPAVILSANGIYFQRVRQIFIEKLEESTLMGRLPDLWPDHMPYIVGHLLRGVTFQTGIRQGSGAATLYHPGPSGLSVLAGGSESIRQRCRELLTQRGGWFEDSGRLPPTRLEFEKAITNLACNLLGLIYGFGDDGNFTRLTIADIMTAKRESSMRELVSHVFDVGRAVKVFAPDDSLDAVFSDVWQRMNSLREHIPSSVQLIGFQIDDGSLEAKFPPTETWLVDPLVRYARSAHLIESVEYFEGLRDLLLSKMEKSVAKMAR